jgi:hypothetical protein
MQLQKQNKVCAPLERMTSTGEGSAGSRSASVLWGPMLVYASPQVISIFCGSPAAHKNAPAVAPEHWKDEMSTSLQRLLLGD